MSEGDYVTGSIRIDPSEISDTLQHLLQEYNVEIWHAVAEAADATAHKTAQELRRTSPVRHDGSNRKWPPGSYRKDWASKALSTRAAKGHTYVYTVYNKKHYQLTHLLEHGHIVKANGKRVGNAKAITHIKPAEEKAQDLFMEEFLNRVE